MLKDMYIRMNRCMVCRVVPISCTYICTVCAIAQAKRIAQDGYKCMTSILIYIHCMI